MKGTICGEAAGRLEPSAIATDVVPGPAVKGVVGGKMATSGARPRNPA